MPLDVERDVENIGGMDEVEDITEVDDDDGDTVRHELFCIDVPLLLLARVADVVADVDSDDDDDDNDDKDFIFIILLWLL